MFRDGKNKREIVQITSSLKLRSRAICITFYRHDKKRVTKVVVLHPRCCIYVLDILSRIGGFNEECIADEHAAISRLLLLFLLSQKKWVELPNEPLHDLIAKLHAHNLMRVMIIINGY